MLIKDIKRVKLKTENGPKVNKMIHFSEIRQIDTVLISQREALEALRQLDQDLYKEAISVDLSLIPFKAKGPFFSPPIPEYLQDGEYENVTKEFQVQYADMNEFMYSITKKKVKKKKTQQDEE